jgi:hypothetical protein
MTTGPEEGTCAYPDEGPGGMPLALRLSEGLGRAATVPILDQLVVKQELLPLVREVKTAVRVLDK